MFDGEDFERDRSVVVVVVVVTDARFFLSSSSQELNRAELEFENVLEYMAFPRRGKADATTTACPVPPPPIRAPLRAPPAPRAREATDGKRHDEDDAFEVHCVVARR